MSTDGFFASADPIWVRGFFALADPIWVTGFSRACTGLQCFLGWAILLYLHSRNCTKWCTCYSLPTTFMATRIERCASCESWWPNTLTNRTSGHRFSTSTARCFAVPCTWSTDPFVRVHNSFPLENGWFNEVHRTWNVSNMVLLLSTETFFTRDLDEHSLFKHRDDVECKRCWVFFYLYSTHLTSRLIYLISSTTLKSWLLYISK